MADINGTNVVAPVVPFTTDDSYPTHMAKYGKGGWRSVQTKAELATIPSQRLEVGMVAYVIEESTPYVYDGSDWKALVIEMDLSKVATEATLIAGIASIEDKIDAIPATDLSQVAKETTLTQGISEIKSAVTNIDLSTIAKESTLTSGVNELKTAIENIDLSSVESKVKEVGNKIDNIKLPEIDTTELAKQGENQEATNSKILEEISKIPNIARLYTAYAVKNDDGENTYSVVLPVSADAIDNGDETVTLKLQ